MYDKIKHDYKEEKLPEINKQNEERKMKQQEERQEKMRKKQEAEKKLEDQAKNLQEKFKAMNEMQKKKEVDKQLSLERAKKKEDKLRAQIPANSKLKEFEHYRRGMTTKTEGGETAKAAPKVAVEAN